jgi:hypothetical protein
MKTLASLFTYWTISGYEIDSKIIYKDRMTIESGGHTDGHAVFHTTVTRHGALRGDKAHIIHRANGRGQILGMISADLFFFDETLFIKNAKLSQLIDFMT